MKRNIPSYFLFAAALFFQAALLSCERNDPEPSTEQEVLLKDSTYFYSSLFNLWTASEGFPTPMSQDDLRAFSSQYSDAEEVMSALRNLTPRIGPNGAPVDRFSFLDRTGQVSEEIGQGVHRDIGISAQLMYLSDNSSDVGLFIRLIQKNSPAETAGLYRGLQVLTVDGVRLNLSANSSGQVTGNIDVANKLLSGDVSTVTVRDWSEDREFNAAISSAASYRTDPIVASAIFDNIGGKKVGYFAYNSFINVVTDRQPNSYYNDLTKLFADFRSHGVNELVVDLRYNGGGSTRAAELLTNLIVPAGRDGEIMYKYAVNHYLEELRWNDPDNNDAPFRPVYIQKQGALNLTRVYFLVTASSASASELVINSLKPYMQVEIISTNNRGTYGKPVGSFGWSVVDGMADLYITSFKMVNARDEGDYYAGLIGTKSNAQDNILRQLGAGNELMLGEALYHIENGSYRTASSTQQARGSRSITVGASLRSLDVDIDPTAKGLFNLDQPKFGDILK